MGATNEGQPQFAASRMGVGPLHIIDEVTEGNEVMEKRERQEGITSGQAKGQTQRWQPLQPNLERVNEAARIDPPQVLSEEPTAVTPHGGICGGESQQWLSYLTNPHVPFDERGRETGCCRMAQATAPVLDSTCARPPHCVEKALRLTPARKTGLLSMAAHRPSCRDRRAPGGWRR